MNLYAIRRRGAWSNLQDLQSAAARSAHIGNSEMADRVRWIRSYVVEEPDRMVGTVCIYEAQDLEAISDHATRVGIPSEDVVPILDTVIVRADPA
jgi:hypothetical protein